MATNRPDGGVSAVALARQDLVKGNCGIALGNATLILNPCHSHGDVGIQRGAGDEE